MKKVRYNLVKSSSKANKKHSIYVRFGQVKVPTGSLIFKSDWNSRESLPKDTHELHDEMQDLRSHLRPLLRNKDYVPPEELKRLIDSFYKDEEEDDDASNIEYPLEKVWELFNDPTLNPKRSGWSTGSGSVTEKWETWRNQTELMRKTEFGDDYVLGFDEHILTFENCRKIMDWVNTYHQWNRNKTRNRWTGKWKELIRFAQGIYPQCRVAIGMFPRLPENTDTSTIQPNEAELNQIFSYSFNNSKHILYRDLMKLAVHLGQHIGNFLKYTQENKTVTVDGHYSIVSKRTKNKGKKTEIVATMITNEDTKKLYDNLIPYSKWTDKSSLNTIKQELHAGIRAIFKEAGIDRMVEGTKNQGGNAPAINGIFPMHEVVAFGVCRNIASTIYRQILTDAQYELQMGHSKKISNKHYADLEQVATAEQKGIMDKFLATNL